MSDLGALRRQRDELNRQIAEAEEAIRSSWNNQLCDLAVGLRRMAGDRGAECGSSTRKNVETVTIGRVNVDLGYIQESYGPSLTVKSGDLRIEFSGTTQTPYLLSHAVLTLVASLLDEEV